MAANSEGIHSFIKWKSEFICKKCFSNEFVLGDQVFSRRCKHCSYDESRKSAFSWYYKVKFHLKKQFGSILARLFQRKRTING